MINRLCIIGTGLIGGSLAIALREAGYCKSIVAGGRNETRLKVARQLGVVDSYSTSYAEAVNDCDLVFVSVPTGAMSSIFEQIKDHLGDNTIVTDGGSTKQSVVNDARQHLGEHFENFVPGHPIAGTEQSGVEAAFGDLYKERKVILTPVDETNSNAINAVKQMWQAAGAHTELMSAPHHDDVLAGTSHLPHLLAYGLVNCLFRREDSEDYFRYAAGGFRDFTRIAASDPVMWRDICLTNKQALLDILGRYQDELAQLREALDNEDADQLLEHFTSAKTSRDKFKF